VPAGITRRAEHLVRMGGTRGLYVGWFLPEALS
jgi:hypothetical protein